MILVEREVLDGVINLIDKKTKTTDIFFSFVVYKMNNKVYLRDNIERVYSLLHRDNFDSIAIEMVIIILYCKNYEQASRLFGVGREAMVRKILPIRSHYGCQKSNDLYNELTAILTNSEELKIINIPDSIQTKIWICNQLFILDRNIELDEMIEITRTLFLKLDNPFYQTEFLLSIVHKFGKLYDER